MMDIPIEPTYLTLFDYGYSQTEEAVEVVFSHEKSFNPHSIKFDFDPTSSENSICVTIPDQPPIFCGDLYGPLSGIEEIYANDETTKLILKKKTPNDWPVIIQSIHSIKKIIDPKSAFLIFACLSQIPPEVQSPGKQNMMLFLKLSAHMCFPPALRILGQLYIGENEQFNEGFSLIRLASEKYNDLEATSQLGQIFSLSSDENARKNGMILLQQAAKSGDQSAMIHIGQLLSPFSSFEWFEKDGLKALKIFQAALEVEPNPLIYHEMAKIYYYGCEGVKQDIAEAQIFQNKAKEQDPRIEDLTSKIEKQKDQDSKSLGSKIAMGTLTIGVLGLFGYYIMKKLMNDNDDN